MALVDLVMPKMGESIMEATILKWSKQPGDRIKQDETVLEIATDKVDTEVPSATSGTIEELLFPEGAVVPVGTVIARIRTSIPETQDVDSKPKPVDSFSSTEKPLSSEHSFSREYTHPSHAESAKANGSSNRFYSPLVLNIAANEGVSLSELESIEGTGNEGRVTKKDILHYVSAKKTSIPLSAHTHARLSEAESSLTSRLAEADVSISAAVPSGNVEIIEMDRMRKLIAEHMVRSKQTSPHVTSFSEADVSALVGWREKVKAAYQQKEGFKMTLTPLFIEAIVKCIKRFPMVNASVEGTRILVKKDIHIGMATALPNGNLIVPVIKNADQYNLLGLAKQVNQLAEQARQGKLRPEDTQDGTFTLTNVGIFGSLMGTPIINQPQVAILAAGAIKKRAVVIEDAAGDSIGIRHMMYLSLSYDHRVVDGSVGATFLSAVAEELEKFDPNREI